MELLDPTPNGYSQAARVPAHSTLVYVSGQFGEGDGWEDQTRGAFQNLTSALARGGATWADVFKLTYYVVDTAELPTVRSVRDEFVDTDRPPTSTLVRVAGLFREGLLIEIEAVAAI
jgi:enamine deaminase RidA (YjgF/YER057c/UK114 family)